MSQTVHIVLRRGEPVAVHATHDEAYEDLNRRTGHGARPDLDAIHHIEAWIVQDERNLSDVDHAAAVARGLIPATRARPPAPTNAIAGESGPRRDVAEPRRGVS